MPVDERSHDRRIVDLMARVQSLEARARQEHQLPASAPAPRERWLARTTSDSPGSYPTSGNTFECELLSCHFPATPGSTTITEIERGRTVIARTRPATYLERGTEVEVWRSRGHGALGVGEWWIGTAPPAPSKNRLFFGGTNYGRDYANVQRKEFGISSGNLRIFPGANEIPTPDVPNVYLEGLLPATQMSPAIRANRAGHYLVTATCTWTFPVISVADHNLLFDSLSGRLGAFSPAASRPNWMTGGPTSGAAHQHQYWPYVPLDMSVLAKLAIETSAGPNVVGWGWSTAPVSAVAAGITVGHRTAQMTVHGKWSPEAGETLTLDLSATYTDDAPYGFGTYQASLDELRISLLWIS